MNLYYFAQNIDHYRGRYLVSAVVAAETEKQACDGLADYCATSMWQGGESPITMVRERVAASLIASSIGPLPLPVGINKAGPQPLKGGASLLTVAVGEDLDGW